MKADQMQPRTGNQRGDSLLDEATAAAEVMAMARRVAESESAVFFADRDCHPQTLSVLKTCARPLGIEVEIGDAEHMPSNRPAGRCTTPSCRDRFAKRIMSPS